MQGQTLTKREIEIIKELSEGRFSKEIAQTLGVSKRTVDWHTANIYQKLGVRNCVSAVREALKKGYITFYK